MALGSQALHEAERYAEQLEKDFRDRQAELNHQSSQVRGIERDLQALRQSQGEIFPPQYL